MKMNEQKKCDFASGGFSVIVDFLKNCGAIGLLLVSSMGVYAAEEGASGGPGGAGASVALGVALIAVAVDDDDDARAETVNPPTTPTTTTTATTATTATTTTTTGT
jgi:hypothetical protein